jgi:hypothetical protein
MENTGFLSTTSVGSLSDSPAPTDEKLLSRYSAHLLTDEVPWRKRTLMLDAARQFLDWWREQYGEDKYHACPAAENWSDHESLWSILRETYLLYACPDRELREGERALLNPFLRFINAGSKAAACEPVGQLMPIDAAVVHQARIEDEGPVLIT